MYPFHVACPQKVNVYEEIFYLYIISALTVADGKG